jgi:hypothetical protein
LYALAGQAKRSAASSGIDCAPWLFTPRFHRADVELTVEEEGKVDLSAHFGGVGLIEGGVSPLAAIARKKSPCSRGRASMYAAASPRVRRTLPFLVGRGWASFWKRYAGGNDMPHILGGRVRTCGR